VCKCLYCILTYFSSDVCLGVVWLNHMLFLFLVLWGASLLFSIVLVLIYIPTNSIWGLLFPHILTNICCFYVLRDIHSNRNEVESWLSFLLWPGMLSISSLFFFWLFVLFPLKNFCLVHLPTSSLNHWVFGNLVFWSPSIFRLLIPCQMYSWPFPFCGLPLQSNDHFFYCAEAF
jgi:hypothetical protein